MRKVMPPIITTLLIAVVALLALYAMGLLDGDDIIQVADAEYGSGAFTYSGGTKDGLFSGNGTIDILDGGFFTGNFKEGRFSGEGIYYSGDSAENSEWYFEGAFQNGFPHNGVFYFSNGEELVWEDSPAAEN